MSWAKRFWEQVTKQRLKWEIRVIENKSGFMLGTMKNVYLLEGLMKRYQRDKKDIYMVFRNLEKAYMEGFRGKKSDCIY